MHENRQHTHKNVTQDIPWEILIERKIMPPKASITMYYSTKNTIAIQPWKPSKPYPQSINLCEQAWIHTSHAMLPTFTNAPLANLSSLVSLNSCLFVFLCHTNIYPCGCLYGSKSHKTTKWYNINYVLPNPLTPHLILNI